MHHPDVELLSASGEPSGLRDDDSFGRVVPVYSDIEGLPPRTFRRLAKRAVGEYARFVEDLLPEPVRRRRRLLTLQEALGEAHFPERFADELARGLPGGQPRRRLAFEELFLVQLGLALRRRGAEGEPAIPVPAPPAAIHRLLSARPLPLNRRQPRTLSTIPGP